MCDCCRKKVSTVDDVNSYVMLLTLLLLTNCRVATTVAVLLFAVFKVNAVLSMLCVS